MKFENAMVHKDIDVNSVVFADYQRPVNKDRVMRIIKEFDIHRMRPIDVSFRDGKYFCFDGQHRVNAYKAMGKKTIPATIHYGCNYQREAMLFIDQSDNVGKITIRDRFNAERSAGKPDASCIVGICEKYGYTVAEKNYNAARNIRCVGSLQKILEEQGSGGLEWVISTINTCWGSLPHAVSCDIIDAMGSLKKNYGFKMDEKRLLNVLKKQTPDTLIRDAGMYRRSTYTCRTNKNGLPVAKTIVGLYNKGFGAHSDKRLIDIYTNF